MLGTEQRTVEQPPTLEPLLSTWRVLPDHVRELRRVHAAALNHAVATRCLALADRGSATVAGVPERARSSYWTTPDLAFAHYVALRGQDVTDATVRAVISSLLHVSATAPAPVDFRGSDHDEEWKRYGLRAFVEDHRRDGCAAEFVPATPNAADVDRCMAAHAILREHWPEMASTIDALVREVVWFGRTAGASSGTLIQTYGAVFLAPGKSLPRLLTALVHETTHVEVIARLGVDDALVNRRDRDVSPFRRRPRPLSRVLHAALVAVRCLEALDRCIDALPAGDREAAAAERRWFAESLDSAVSSLQRSGRWTPLGARLFEDLVARRAQIDVA